MAYSAALNTVYNHYLASYAPKSTTRYDTHKRGELKSIYNSIVKLSKESPLYLIDTSRASQGFAVDLKENARQLRNTIASLGGLELHGQLRHRHLPGRRPLPLALPLRFFSIKRLRKGLRLSGVCGIILTG